MIQTLVSDELQSYTDEHGTFDVALVISSVEHDGLGRYGDPLDPDGDVRAMAEVSSAVKSEGKVLLAVPCGPDALVWNVHRRYGRRRLPQLLANWTMDGQIGVTAEILDTPSEYHYQPVFILSNTRPSQPHAF
mmetsp:Transcript_63252/g.149904  ORF Transcript_63252/g.149904 Transcript_63252/m.149904 type:complete len:133 (-) Transcript_63252:16-414(-)